MTDETSEEQKAKEERIKENLRRAYREKAEEELPAHLLALIEKLKAQDGQDGTN